MAVPTLLKLSKTSEARVRANCARTLKHMTSDTTDALEEGAVASLLSMYFQGRDRMVLSEDMGVPLLQPCPVNDSTPPRCIEDEITDTLWFHVKVSTSGGPAGKGPPPPEPPRYYYPLHPLSHSLTHPPTHPPTLSLTHSHEWMDIFLSTLHLYHPLPRNLVTQYHTLCI